MLVLTRVEGAVTYGGRALTQDLDNSFEHMICVDRIVDNINERYVLIAIINAEGDERTYRLDHKKDTLSLGNQVQLTMVSIGSTTTRNGKSIPIMRLGIDAPRSYRVVRDNAIRKGE